MTLNHEQVRNKKLKLNLRIFFEIGFSAPTEIYYLIYGFKFNLKID